ncbi:MAG: DUF2914 domain-containing protein [Methylotenera sp.]|nr:DUF2914 domain-containing protein [Oligoflexia bacterium]
MIRVHFLTVKHFAAGAEGIVYAACMFTPARELYKKHEKWIPIVFFLLGFAFDAIMLKRIDEPAVMIQQALYLIICGIFISVELIETNREVHPPAFLVKVWKYREAIFHFFLGTLLNSYTIFYFKSASALTSLAFIGFLAGILMLNEFKRFGKSQTQVHMALLSLCLISYLVGLVPILLGFLGTLPFLIAVVACLLIFAGFFRLLQTRLTTNPRILITHIFYPFAAIQLLFATLYFAHAIPPVPLSVTYMGIYHDVKKENGEYLLTYTHPEWRFWQHGDQHFLARPGDSVYCFVQVFSPTRFKESLKVRWLYYDERQRDWQSADAIPMPIVGGREEGFRGVTKKDNYRPGKWRVQIETDDEREVGRIGFTVVEDTSTDERRSWTKVR